MELEPTAVPIKVKENIALTKLDIVKSDQASKSPVTPMLHCPSSKKIPPPPNNMIELTKSWKYLINEKELLYIFILVRVFFLITVNRPADFSSTIQEFL